MKTKDRDEEESKNKRAGCLHSSDRFDSNIFIVTESEISISEPHLNV